MVNYSTDEQRGAIRWIYHLVYIMSAIFLIMNGLFLFSGTAQPVMLILQVFISVFKCAILSHNVLLENFVLIQQNGDSEYAIINTDKRVNIRRLEAYMRRDKPYLRSKLKITDMTAALATNRTSLSTLINRNYGMNFCYYVNRFRLEELERLKSDPANARLSEMDMVFMAGFSDWRGYQRVIKRESIQL